MKATLQFDLPEENQEFHMANKACAAHAALCDFADYLRKHIEYPAENMSEAESTLWEAIQTDFFSVVSDYDLKLHDNY